MKKAINYLCFIVLAFHFSCSTPDTEVKEIEWKCNGIDWTSFYPINTPDLYFGVENQMELSLFGVPSGDFRPEISGYNNLIRRSRVKQWLYYIKPGTFNGVTVRIRTTIDNFKEFTFKVKKLPNPIPSLDSMKVATEGGIELKKLKEANRIYLLFPDFDFDADCKVESFKMTLYQDDRKTYEVENLGADFSKEIIYLISDLNSSDEVSFTNIKVKCPGDSIHRTISPMIYEIL